MEQFNMFMSSPDIDMCLKVYNIPETEFVQKMTEVTLPSIKLHQVVYLPMLDEILTLDNLKKTADDYQIQLKTKDLGGNAKFQTYDNSIDRPLPSDLCESIGASSLRTTILKKHYIEELQSQKNPLYLTKTKLYNPDKHVMVRILSPIEFPVDWKNRMINHDMIEQHNNKDNTNKKTLLSSFSSIGSLKKINAGKNFFQW
jgi:hypothetical protein